MIGLDYALKPIQVANNIQLTGVLLNQLLVHSIRIRGRNGGESPSCYP